MSVNELESVDISTSRWDSEWWHTTNKEIAGSKPSAQDRRTDWEAKTWSQVRNRILPVPWHRRLVLAEVNPSMCFVSQFSVHKMGMMAVPLSQACSEDKALTPMRCCDMKLRGYARKIFEPPSVAQLLNTQQSSFVLTDLREGEKYCLHLTTGKKKVLVASLTSPSISWVRCQGPRYHVSL